MEGNLISLDITDLILMEGVVSNLVWSRFNEHLFSGLNKE